MKRNWLGTPQEPADVRHDFFVTPATLWAQFTTPLRPARRPPLCCIGIVVYAHLLWWLLIVVCFLLVAPALAIFALLGGLISLLAKPKNG